MMENNYDLFIFILFFFLSVNFTKMNFSTFKAQCFVFFLCKQINKFFYNYFSKKLTF